MTAAPWQDGDEVVFSSTLDEVPTRRTTIERRLDARVVGTIAARGGDATIGGPTLAAEAFGLDLLDVVHVTWSTGCRLERS